MKKQDPNTSFQKVFQPAASGSSQSNVATAHGHDPCQLSGFELSSTNAASSSGQHCQSMLTAPVYARGLPETLDYSSQRTQMTLDLVQGGHSTITYCNLQKKFPCDNGLSRFMPRTTQLQERKRKRDEDNKLSLIGFDTNSTEITIGPKLPEIPKIEMGDESLNTSANLIRTKLKEVCSSKHLSIFKMSVVLKVGRKSFSVM